MTVIASIHQPNFLPWLGYFHKMTYSDVFVFLDLAQYTKQTYINRCVISQAGKEVRLIIPVSLDKWDAEIRDVRVEPKKFARKHLESLRIAYGKCPHYDSVMAVVRPSYEGDPTNLADFNIGLIQAISGFIGIHPQFVRLSDLHLGSSKNQLLIDIANACDVDAYVSGVGARAYIDGHEHEYEKAGVDLSYQNFEHPTYPQRNNPFIKGCSILDLLFNCGAQALEFLQQQDVPPYLGWQRTDA
jgi:hypothetical protein